MSVQVSYKKQTLMTFIGLLILFGAIEIIANVWWIAQINCEFEDSEIFQDMSESEKRDMCFDLYKIQTSGNQLIPNQSSSTLNINSLGFRGSDFSENKPDDTYRIFMLGGSTMFGFGATSDETTIPGFFQKHVTDLGLSYYVETINAGIQGAESSDELSLLENQLIDYSPDLVIIYDGWNDLRSQNSPEDVSDNWNSLCAIGIKNDFDVIVALQPIAGFGNKILTFDESGYVADGTTYAGELLINQKLEYENYSKNLMQLDDCSLTLDMRYSFDDEQDSIYWDQGHVSDKGNEIIAKSLAKHSAEILPNSFTFESTNSQNNSNDDFELVFRNIFSYYKTPLMINSLLTLPSIHLMSESPTQLEAPANFAFESTRINTISQEYNSQKIYVSIELIPESSNNLIKINTVDELSQTNLVNVTYFLKISHNGNTILTDFFYVEGDTFLLEVVPDNSEQIQVLGNRQYEHNAIIVDSENTTKVSGDLLEKPGYYEFQIEIRTMHNPSNWIFSLEPFTASIFLE